MEHDMTWRYDVSSTTDEYSAKILTSAMDTLTFDEWQIKACAYKVWRCMVEDLGQRTLMETSVMRDYIPAILCEMIQMGVGRGIL